MQLVSNVLLVSEASVKHLKSDRLVGAVGIEPSFPVTAWIPTRQSLGLPEDETRIETKIQRAFPWSPHSNDDLRLSLRSTKICAGRR